MITQSYSLAPHICVIGVIVGGLPFWTAVRHLDMGSEISVTDFFNKNAPSIKLCFLC